MLIECYFLYFVWCYGIDLFLKIFCFFYLVNYVCRDVVSDIGKRVVIVLLIILLYIKSDINIIKYY